jgi:alpha-L-rhamnosidase
MHSDLEETGEFSCSHAGVNQLQHNIRWSQKGNFLEVPSDCPQREKMGWTGDIQIYAPTACFLMDSAAFLTKWLRDLAADQHEDGLVPHVIPWPPDYPMFKIVGTGGSAGWGDACTVVPTTLYRHYGDERILAEMYPVMKRWLAFIESRASGRIWRRRMHWGDWLEPGRSTVYYHLPWAPKGYVATPFWAHSAELTAHAARILGHEEEAAGFEGLAREVKQAYLRRYVRADGRIRPSRQGAYVLALAFDMVPEPLRPRLAEHLAELVRAKGCHLDTGFLSTAHLCDVLCRFGHEDLAFALLEQETVPSWLYQVGRGATTIWETWDVVRADGRLRKGLSLNHYAFGAVGDWLYRHVAGIAPSATAPGFERVRIASHPGGSLTRASARLRSGYGEIESSWQVEAGLFEQSVRVPPNTSAGVRLPGASLDEVRESGRPLVQAEAVAGPRQEADAVELEIGSGHYVFSYPYRPGPAKTASPERPAQRDQERQSQGIAAKSSNSST